jgi:hypothetical protein
VRRPSRRKTFYLRQRNFPATGLPEGRLPLKEEVVVIDHMRPSHPLTFDFSLLSNNILFCKKIEQYIYLGLHNKKKFVLAT